MQILSVGQLTTHIKEKLESDFLLSNVWVKGEVSNFKHHSSGHMYFTLKDKTSALRCIMFKSRNNSLNFKPQEGMAVIARGYVNVYERDGQYQLYIEEMQPDGVGVLYTAFTQLKEKLEREGLFEPRHKRPLPTFPRKVGVITSLTGAAIRDIITVMTRRYPQVHVIIIPVAVQGDIAPLQIADAIKLAHLPGDLDLLIVGRGGGSIEELWAFNTEIVARSIFESKIPVISAVGHETDFTIADFVADRRAPTPSAAAEIAVPDLRELEKYLDNLRRRMMISIKNNVSALKERVRRAMENQVLKRPKDELYRKMQDLDYLTKRLGQATLGQVNSKKSNLILQLSRLDDLSPLATLKRGYAILREPNGLAVKETKRLKAGDRVEVIISDGTVDCTVNRVKEDTNGCKN